MAMAEDHVTPAKPPVSQSRRSPTVQIHTSRAAGLPPGPLKPHKSRSLPTIIPPGPGQYEADLCRRKLQNHTPKATFPNARRFEWGKVQQSPGPGDFLKTLAQDGLWRNHAGDSRHKLPFSIVARKMIETKAGPGPMDYSPKKTQPDKPERCIPKSRRWKPPDATGAGACSPGPADYRKTAAELGRMLAAPRQPYFSAVSRACAPSHSPSSLRNSPSRARSRLASAGGSEAADPEGVNDGTILIARERLTIFAGPDSWDEIGKFAKGETFAAAGPPVDVDGIAMVPIYPTGAVCFEQCAISHEQPFG